MLIGKNLVRRKGRTVMTIAAVAISMALLISMLAIAEGIWVDAVGDLEKSKEDILITPGTEVGGTLNNGHELTNNLNADTANLNGHLDSQRQQHARIFRQRDGDRARDHTRIFRGVPGQR